MRYFLFFLSLILSSTIAAADLTQGDKEAYQKCKELQAAGNWLEAKDIAKGLVAKFAGDAPSRHQIVFLNELANLNQRLGLHGDSIANYQACLERVVPEMGPNSVIEAQIKNNFSSLMLVIGDFAKAEKLSRESVAMREQLSGKGSLDAVPARNNLGAILWCIGDLAGAEELYRDGLKIRLEQLGPNNIDTAISQANLAGLLFYRNEIEEAAPLAETSVTTFVLNAGPHHPQTLEAKLFLGEIRRAQGKPAEALELYEECREGRVTAFGTAEHVEVAEADRRIGDAHREMRNYVDALRFYQTSNVEYTAVLDARHVDLLEGTYGAGLSAFAEGSPAAALTFARECSKIEFHNLESILEFTDERQRLAYQDMFRSKHLFASLGAAEDLGTFLLRQKGVVIDSLIAEARLLDDASDPEVAQALTRLRERRAEYRTAFLSGEAGAVSPEQASGEVQEAFRSLLTKLGKKDLGSPLIDATVSDLQATLNPGEAVFDYVAYDKYLGGADFEKRYGAVVITSDNVQYADCTLAKPVDDIVETLAVFLADPSQQDDVGARQLMATLYEALIAPPLAKVPDAESLIICPDRQLSFIPFAATIDPDDRFLIETRNVSYVSATRALLARPSEVPRKNGALLVGNPAYGNGDPPASAPGSDERGLLTAFGAVDLELVASALTPLVGAEKEVEELSGVLDSAGIPADTIIGEKATERGLHEAVKKPYLLHLATHGLYLPALAPQQSASEQSNAYVPNEVAGFSNPMFGSWLAFTGSRNSVLSWKGGSVPDPNTDGILMANEAAELDLEGTQIVTLSACDTASGEATNGDGVLGIRRGFRLAGAENIVTTLWPINDAITPQIMKDFYRGLDSATPADSLSETQRKWLTKIRNDPEAVSIPTVDGDLVPVGGLFWALNLAAPFLLSR